MEPRTLQELSAQHDISIPPEGQYLHRIRLTQMQTLAFRALPGVMWQQKLL